MGWLFSIFLIILGALAVYPAIVQTWPGTKQGLDRLLPYQGWIGVLGVIWGLVFALQLLAHAGAMGTMTGYPPIIWLVSLAGAVIAMLLGLLFGYSLIAQHALGNNEQFRRRGEELRARLFARQSPLGWAALVLGIINFLMFLVR